MWQARGRWAGVVAVSAPRCPAQLHVPAHCALEYHIPKISRTELAGEVVNTEVQIHRVEFVNSSGAVSENPRDIRCEMLPVPRP